MCGIAGIVNLGSESVVAKPELLTMSRELTHRGPDDDGHYVDP